MFRLVPAGPPPPPPPPPPAVTPAPVRPVGPATPVGPGSAGGGTGSVTNGNAQAIGQANANAPPGGFGVALGIGAAIATPFGNIVIGQGNAASAGK